MNSYEHHNDNDEGGANIVKKNTDGYRQSHGNAATIVTMILETSPKWRGTGHTASSDGWPYLCGQQSSSPASGGGKFSGFSSILVGDVESMDEA
jgi:hypothetical protein